MVNYKKIKEVIESIPNDEQIFISGHLNPDMDSVGTSLALARYLNSIGKSASVLLDQDNFKILKWFDDYAYVIDEPKLAKKEKYTFIMLDANEKKRLGRYEKYFDNARLTIQIDHHENNDGLSNYIVVASEISSTSEMMYSLLKLFDKGIDSKIAELLYAEIVTDTKGFFQRTSTQTFLVASKLLEYNIDYQYITRATLKRMSYKDVVALSHAILDLEFDRGLCYIVIDDEKDYYSGLEYNAFAKLIAPFIQNIDDTDIILAIYKSGNKITINVRSNTDIEVTTFAGLFGGGGHKYAAGAIVYDTKVDTIIESAKKHLIK